MSRIELRMRPSPSGSGSDEVLLGLAQHAIGSVLVLAAWGLAIMDQDRAASSALLPGLLIFGLSAASQLRFRAVIERAIALIGAWTLIAPWALGFAANDAGTWVHTIFGAATVAAAAASLNHAGTR
ncbi:SPW repeat protein [Methylobacterium sp. NEAU K]|uniref:SPW repeat protein n=1 Tax=Methylobacterium sp. NEAU K TaxID=3064946 RepID=UPI0027362412|nr:SPW repeat protein [Methylobacterium sp. NEAU K]MDP4003354.1 SPW repeat protein [Methylobacterium sp. NEAU K]